MKKNDFGWSKENARRSKLEARIRTEALTGLLEFENGIVEADTRHVNYPYFVFSTSSLSCPICRRVRANVALFKVDYEDCPASPLKAGTCDKAGILRTEWAKGSITRKELLQRLWELVVLTREWVWSQSKR